jgi:hypothetical protein
MDKVQNMIFWSEIDHRRKPLELNLKSHYNISRASCYFLPLKSKYYLFLNHAQFAWDLEVYTAVKWRQNVPLKHYYLSTRPHGVTTLKNNNDIITAVRTSDLVQIQLTFTSGFCIVIVQYKVCNHYTHLFPRHRCHYFLIMGELICQFTAFPFLLGLITLFRIMKLFLCSP